MALKNSDSSLAHIVFPLHVIGAVIGWGCSRLSLWDPNWQSSYHHEIAGHCRGRDLWRVLQQPLNAWAASDTCHFCAQSMVCSQQRVFTRQSLQECLSCRALTQGHTLPRAAHIQWLLQVGLPRHNHFDPMWGNSDGHFSSRPPWGFGPAYCWATWLLPLPDPAPFSSFPHRLLPRTPLSKHSVH